MLFVGIDPGASGGIALLDGDGSVLAAIKMPSTDRDLLDMLVEGFIDGAVAGSLVRPARAVLERVWSSPQMGVASAFKFGVGVGALRLALTAARIPYDEVTPQRWQQALGCRAGTSRAAGGPGGDKNVTKRRAQQLFPGLKVTHAIADALLIAEYCRRLERAQPFASFGPTPRRRTRAAATELF